MSDSGLLAIEVGAVETSAEDVEEIEMPYECPCELFCARETHETDALLSLDVLYAEGCRPERIREGEDDILGRL